MNRELIPGSIWKNFKGNKYKILDIVKDSETEKDLVIYQALYGEYLKWARPKDMFLSEVDHDKYPDIDQKYRFEKISEN